MENALTWSYEIEGSDILALVKGRRLSDASIYSGVSFAPGDYMRDPLTETWWVKPPHGGRLGELREHQVQEHQDGTITVSPSILQGPGANPVKQPGWHGYLRAGVWEERA